MDFLNSGIPLGHIFGIQVRLHFTFLLYAIYRLQEFPNLLYGSAFLAGLYLCILLHELGHALVARWADGEAHEVLLWPLGGLAWCRPAWHPTAHLIATAAGPLVTLGLFLLFRAATVVLGSWAVQSGFLLQVWSFLGEMARLNLWLLVFNLIPAFPMDGGRILRDALWHWLGVEKATQIAVWTSRLIAVVGIAWSLASGFYWLILLALFVLLQAHAEYAQVGFEAGSATVFSVTERLRRGRRQREFRRGITAQKRMAQSEGFHRCAECGRTEQDDSLLEFRVCPDCSGGQEYCQQHVDSHIHR
ncbi:MAG: site-2 protease family protein [Verrucomicrobiae bacterium]|nr:site-2 protease family protein [Verrucomicrobiae bacterium]